MIFTILFLMRLLEKVESSCCRQDKGVYKQFNSAIDPNFQCLNGIKYAGQISFYCTFANVPQIIIATLSYEYEKNAQFQFKIQTTTTQEWTFSIQCFSPTDKLQKYEFTWIAADDNRLYVVNDYMDSTILVDGYVSPLYKHPNPPLNGYIASKTTIVSYFGGNADTLVSYLTWDTAAFKIWQGTSGLGVQFILGWSDCLQLQQNQMFVYVNNPNIQVAVLSNSNYIPIIFYHAWYIQAIQLQLESDLKSLNIIANPQIDGTIKINAEWNGSGSAYFYKMSYIVYFAQEPLYYKKMRISKKLCLDYKEFAVVWRLYVSQLNQNFTDPQVINFNGNLNTLNLIYNFNCQPNKKIVGKVLLCTDCSQQYLTFTQYCIRKFNLMTIRLNFLQTNDVHGTFKFELNNEGFSIYQTITQVSICQEISEIITYQLIQLNVQDA